MNISGVILVIIVALWGSLLVPALVRKHDNVTEVRSVDRFSYALRILSRRTPYIPGRRDVLVARKSAKDRRPVVSPTPEFAASVAAPQRQTATSPAARVAANRSALARKRRRALLGLTLALVVCVSMAVRSGGRWWLTVAISVVLMVMYVTHLRTEAQQLATIDRRRAQARRRAGRQQEMVEPRARRVAEPIVATYATYADDAEYVRPVAAMPDGSWAPVPVTLPTYVSKPVVTRPPVAPPTGGWFDGVLAEQQAARFASGGDLYDQMSDDGLSGGLGLGRDDDAQYGIYGPDGLDDIIERRRAVND
ncbi:hypothetical protein acdb102_28170 [Acidothermaceae bacterium B102]|nr:hypothetical protein acdb102_28170 [Acidothermaceae bacterium B102]